MLSSPVPLKPKGYEMLTHKSAFVGKPAMHKRVASPPPAETNETKSIARVKTL